MGGSGGPPPAEEEKIKALLHFTIGQDEVTNGMNKKLIVVIEKGLHGLVSVWDSLTH